MPLTPEQRAANARHNGAKSRGPKTDQGKANSSRNGIKSGLHTSKLAAFIPPNSAVLCNEDRQAFFSLIDHCTQIYQPLNQEAAELVRQIAIARWHINRLQNQITSIWNFALLEQAAQPASVVEELEDTQFAARTAIAIFSGNSPIERMNRQIDRLEMRITRLRNSIKDVHKHFPNAAKPNPINESPNETEKSEPTVYVTEHSPEVLAAYRREFPNHKIVLLPPDDVANGVESKDDLPPAPRKAA